MHTGSLLPPPPGPRLRTGLVALAALAVFCGSLANDFVYDDVSLVLENPWLRSAEGLREAFSQPLFGYVDDLTEQDLGAGYYRPLAHVTYFLLRAVFGTAPWGYHLFLVLAHVLTSVLVAWLLRASLVRGRPGGAAEWAALAGALLFALHPIHTEAVAWVSGWMDVGVALAVLLAARLV
ncbi:MAG TPA: hypothetical protein VE153_27935, partial [Myxococcus sp.]|nr:hypothetical protein [Myxococcus sp.]